MSLLGFKARFAGPVERREKRQTIRAKVHGHAIGRPIQLYTGLRTKSCRKLVADDPVCMEIRPIIVSEKRQRIILDGRIEIGAPTLVDFARDDGFPDLDSFWAFFRQPDGKEFDGFLIRWDWP